MIMDDMCIGICVSYLSKICFQKIILLYVIEYVFA